MNRCVCKVYTMDTCLYSCCNNTTI